MISRVRRHRRSRIASIVVTATLVMASAAHAQRAASPVPTGAAGSAVALAPPESVGMSAARLARLTTVFRKEIDDKKVPGTVMMVARKGKLVYATALGVRDPKNADGLRTEHEARKRRAVVPFDAEEHDGAVFAVPYGLGRVEQRSPGVEALVGVVAQHERQLRFLSIGQPHHHHR